MLTKKEIKANQLAIQYMYSRNHLKMGKAVSEVTAMGKKYYSLFVKLANINIFKDTMSYYETIGDSAERLERYVSKGVLLEAYKNQKEDLDQFILCRLLALSTDEELSEMDNLKILVPGVDWYKVHEFHEMKDSKKQDIAA